MDNTATLAGRYALTAFQATPSGEIYEEEFLSVAASLCAHWDNALGKDIARVTRQNHFPFYPVIGYKEFPEENSIGGAVEKAPGLYRAMVLGELPFLSLCGLNVPETLEVARRRWEAEGAYVLLGGWDGWVRGIFKFTPQ